MYTESQIYKLLKHYNIDVPNFCSFKIYENIPEIDFYPCALKIESKKIIHKSDVGGVILNIKNKKDLDNNIVIIKKNIENKNILLDKNDSFIVTEMITGEELYFGMIDDDIFGKTILFGKGGILLELYKDICYIDSEAQYDEIKKAISTPIISKIFNHFRSLDLNESIIIDFIKNLQNFICHHPNLIEMDLNPVIIKKNKLIVVDARIKESPTYETKYYRRDRPNFFDNNKVAIVGSSTDPNKVGYAVSKNALSFCGELYFVNQNGGMLFDKKLYKTLNEINSNFDTIVYTIPAKCIMSTIKNDIKNFNVKNIIIISAGFKEVGNKDSEELLATIAKEFNINIIGPNCLGYYLGAKNLNLTFANSNILNGNIALISQSGAVLTCLLDKAYQAGIGFSHIISVGNMVDLDFPMIIDMLNNDPNCKYIAIYAEGIKHGKEFLKQLRVSKKPIYLFKTGKSEESKKAAFSHTGNLSGNYNMFKGLVESCGTNIQDTLEALIYNPIFNSNNIAIVTNAGGPASILADYIIEKQSCLYNLNINEIKQLNNVLPFNWSKNNPIDIIGDARSDRYKVTLETINKFEKIELVYLLITPQFMTDTIEIVKLCLDSWRFKIIPILLGGEMMNDAKKYLNKNKILYFDSLRESTTFL